MKIKNVSLLTLLSTLVILLACGGGGMAEETSPEPVAEAETTPVEEQTSSTPAMLGGGKATEVHPGNGGSPHVKVDWMIQGANISITYGRPYLKGRVVGESVPPMESGIWRLGADEATTLSTDKDMMIGGEHVPAVPAPVRLGALVGAEEADHHALVHPGDHQQGGGPGEAP